MHLNKLQLPCCFCVISWDYFLYLHRLLDCCTSILSPTIVVTTLPSNAITPFVIKSGITHQFLMIRYQTTGSFYITSHWVLCVFLLCYLLRYLSRHLLGLQSRFLRLHLQPLLNCLGLALHQIEPLLFHLLQQYR